jgi:hypothetical protein
MTNIEIIEDAMRAIGVLAETESASANQGALGLRRMNDLLAYWEATGVDLQYPPQSSTTADFPLTVDVVLAVKYNLAAMLCPDYERQVPPIVASLASTSWYTLLRKAASDARVESTLDHLPKGEAWGSGYDITTDS